MKRTILFGFFLLTAFSGDASAEGVPPGFHATLTGAKTAGIEAEGVFKCVPPMVSLGELRPGLFFLADGQGIRDYGITFTLPLSAGTGKHALKPHSPFEVGKRYEVRIDIDVPEENRTARYQEKPDGTLTLTSLVTRKDLRAVKGSFDFSIENKAGERIQVTGAFHLPMERIREDIPDLEFCHGSTQ